MTAREPNENNSTSEDYFARAATLPTQRPAQVGCTPGQQITQAAGSGGRAMTLSVLLFGEFLIEFL
jgi:hypothetical protein